MIKKVKHYIHWLRLPLLLILSCVPPPVRLILLAFILISLRHTARVNTAERLDSYNIDWLPIARVCSKQASQAFVRWEIYSSERHTCIFANLCVAVVNVQKTVRVQMREAAAAESRRPSTVLCVKCTHTSFSYTHTQHTYRKGACRCKYEKKEENTFISKRHTSCG